MRFIGREPPATGPAPTGGATRLTPLRGKSLNDDSDSLVDRFAARGLKFVTHLSGELRYGHAKCTSRPIYVAVPQILDFFCTVDEGYLVFAQLRLALTVGHDQLGVTAQLSELRLRRVPL